MTTSKKNTIAFNFVLEELYALDPIVKPMFGCHAVYVNGKILLMLRNKDSYQEDNGVWIATTYDHHSSLRKDLPSMRTIKLFGGSDSAWQNLPSMDERFEQDAVKACSLILKGDVRIGKTPGMRKKKKRN